MTHTTQKIHSLIDQLDCEQIDILSISIPALKRNDTYFIGQLKAYIELGHSEIEQKVYPDYISIKTLTKISERYECMAWGRLFTKATLRGDAPAVEFLNGLAQRRVAN